VLFFKLDVGLWPFHMGRGARAPKRNRLVVSQFEI
jgi:hypothetical protein